MKKDFLDFAFEYYNQYVANYKMSTEVKPIQLCHAFVQDGYLHHNYYRSRLNTGLLSFRIPAFFENIFKEETYLFKLLFIDDMDLNMVIANDFYKEIGNVEKAKAFSKMIGVELAVHENTVLYQHQFQAHDYQTSNTFVYNA